MPTLKKFYEHYYLKHWCIFNRVVDSCTEKPDEENWTNPEDEPYSSEGDLCSDGDLPNPKPSGGTYITPITTLLVTTCGTALVLISMC